MLGEQVGGQVRDKGHSARNRHQTQTTRNLEYTQHKSRPALVAWCGDHSEPMTMALLIGHAEQNILGSIPCLEIKLVVTPIQNEAIRTQTFV